jgi:hypothetical protein
MEDLPMKIRASCALMSVFFVLLATQAWGGFSVAPLRFEFDLEKGRTGTASIRVSNNGEEPVSVKVYQKDFMVDPINQDIILAPGKCKRGCAEWLIISPSNLDLGPKERKNVRITLTVPEDARGTYWAIIFVEQSSKPTPIRKLKGGYSFQINVKPRWLVRIHENVPGTGEKKGQVTDISVTPQAAESPLKIAVEFENTGNMLLRCNGYVEIRDEGGNEVETIQIGSKGRFSVYPDGKRLVSGTVSKRLSPGDYIALAIVDYGGEELVAGELEFQVK